MNRLDHVASVNSITICKAIQKIIIKLDSRYQTDVKKKSEEGLS